MNSGDRIRVRAVLPPMLAGRTGRVTGSTGRGTLVALDEPPEGFGRVCLFAPDREASRTYEVVGAPRMSGWRHGAGPVLRHRHDRDRRAR